MPHLIDLSHPVTDGMITYPGLPAPRITEHLTREDSRSHYAPGTEFHIGRIDLVANTGTYLDTPFHRYTDGFDLAGLPLETVADIDAVVIRLGEGREVSAAHLDDLDVSGRAVLIHTGWDRHWGTDAYFDGHPYLTQAGAEWLVANGSRLVGIDSLNIDRTDGGDRPAHSTLLRAGIPVVEHLCHLDRLPDDGFRFSAVPVRVAGMGTFPVRAYARVEN